MVAAFLASCVARFMEWTIMDDYVPYEESRGFLQSDSDGCPLIKVNIYARKLSSVSIAVTAELDFWFPFFCFFALVIDKDWYMIV